MIELDGVRKAFGAVPVLKGITARVAKGEVVCVIGPSGSGKSTLLRCINGLESYDGGEIRVNGTRVDRTKREIRTVRTQVSMVFQRFNLFPHRTALENVIEGPVYVKGEPKAEAAERGRALLARVGLAGREAARPAQLSGGQQQRVAIARALAMRPDAILFDEPTSALDPISTGKIEDLLEQLKADFTIVIVTHNMQQAARISQYTAFMYLGEVIEFAATNTIFMNPSKKQTQDYVTGRFG